jgi:phosphomannomutase/phosphoglucomutase
MAKLEKTMFREYDIRGRVNDEELNPNSVYIINKGFAKFLSKRGIKKAIVGHDSRPSSPKFHQVTIKALIDSGLDVIDIGLSLSPIFYFAQYHFETKGGIMITGSHNPPGWSGFKHAYDYSLTLLPDDVKEVYELAIKEYFIQGKGRVEKKDAFKPYLEDAIKKVSLKRKLKVVCCCNHGTAGAFAPAVLKAAGCDVIELYCNLDVAFPHGNPNPSVPELMLDCGKKVREAKADIGLGFDGDGDRLGVVDEKGEFISMDKVEILLARHVLKHQPGAKIIFDVKCSETLPEDIKAHGGIPIMWITGHSYIKAKRMEEDAELAGEFSGHIFYKEHYGFDDAIYAALKLLEFLSNRKETMSQLLATIPQYVSTSTLHADCADEVKYQIQEKLTKEFKDMGLRVIDINGARVYLDHSTWGLVRPSSNLPVLVLRFEAKSKKKLEEIQKLFRQVMDKYPEISKDWHHG